ncbi:MAG TPA: hypothetical protein DE179_13560 [Oceanospirillaceae bacterium]|nr:hypothetical protein [Oceanospirillaceae bacterium]
MDNIGPAGSSGPPNICACIYENKASRYASHFDYPLSSRFHENEAILSLDKVSIPWQDVLIYKGKAKLARWSFVADFGRLYPLQTCSLFAVKLVLLVALSEQCMANYDASS